ncbi:hypothetical protein BDZ89DRAFT_1173686 [Hymenopellis radicata]|nr:hypothetical protein BDZ89DRAFT_1173686 [Hymenopellis radicata]
MALASHPAVGRIRSALAENSFTSGTCKIPVEQCDLYYKGTSPSVATYLNLANATDAEMAQLVVACDAAPFGRGSETVVDETYRRARKLDLSRFALPFELAGTGIINKIYRDLVKSDTALHRFIRAEPYKLNIYDKGAFFKAHQDTPRAENMFGSLVVVFPTAHEGGALVLREKGSEWSFDSAQMLAKSTSTEPEIAYVAFYSDTEHEILPVTSGSRVTLTYNLYFEDTANLLANPTAPSAKHLALKDAIQELVADPDLRSQGVRKLCFGLAHQYPVRKSESQNLGHSVSELKQYLKGGDALIYSVCQEHGLQINVKVLYDMEFSGGIYLGTEPAHAPKWPVDDEAELTEGMEVIQIPTWDDTAVGEETLFWVTPQSKASQIETTYVVYGNDASLGHVYGEICLVVEL